MSKDKKEQEINITGSTIGGANFGDHGSIKDVNVTVNSSGASTDEIARLFSVLYQKVGELPDGPDKAAAQSAIQGLETEAEKGDKADERTIHKWLNFLVETAPDAWQVAVNTFQHPVKGLNTVFQKVALRAKADKEE